MHPACPNKKQNHLQNSLLRRTQFWVRNTFSKPASLKRASLVVLCCFTHSMVWQCDVCVCVFSFVLFPAIPIPELIQCYHLTFFTSFWTGPPITSKLLVCLVWVSCLACLCFGLLLLRFVWLCFLCCFLNGL